uniref:Integrase catalytic domain-containing protein n=1 Tax=Tanacetum cinerariifolium TaxID=118510 RepID=A0A6L2JCN1_TANCI|nr:hypothetical protein [Tanacetum cinerariifolium]
MAIATTLVVITTTEVVVMVVNLIRHPPKTQCMALAIDVHSDTGANSHVKPDLEAMDNSEAYYGDNVLHVGNGKAQKSDMYSTFKLFVQMVKRQFTTKLKNVQTNWGGEFRNLASFFSSLGIIHRRSCPHTSEKNGFVERRNRYVVETGLTLLAQTYVPQCFWHYAFDIAVYLINHMPSRTSTNKSPFEHIFKRSSDYTFLRVFGLHQYQYHHYLHRHHPSLDNVLQIFVKISTSFIVANNSPEWRQAMKEEYDALIKNGTWSLVPRASNTNVFDGNNKGTIDNIICQLGSAFVLKDLGPLNYFLGIEIVSHVSNILLTQKKSILELLQSAGLSICNPVSSLMVTSSSLSLDDSAAFSNPIKYRKVVGSLQYVTLSRPDIDFAVKKVCQYMHAPTENHCSADKRILRYLHGTVEHGMRVRRSSGSTLQAFTNVTWKGNSDTSLKAFSDADWLEIQMIDAEYKDLADIVVELTWLQALFNELGVCSSSTPILWCDNLGNNKGTINNGYCQLGSAFALKDLGPLNYFLCIEIVSHVSGILLSQKKSILELLQSAGLSNCNLVSSPMLTSSSLSLDDSTAFSNLVKYRQVVGSLQYITLSRLDMAFAVNKVCQYIHAPTENHWSAVKRILRYLHGTVEHGMLIRRSSSSTLQAFTNVLWKGNSDTSLEAFSDADWLEIQMIDEAEYKDLADTLLSSHGFKLFLMSLKTVHLQLLYYGNNKGTIDNTICQLGSVFALKDLGPLNYFLGIEIVSHVSGILLSQKKSILELLQSAGLSNCNLVSSLMVTSSSFSLDDNTAFSNPIKYQKVVVKRILRYLHGTVEHGMLIRRSSGSNLQAFTNVLWKGRFAIYLGSNLISWTARKQRTTLCSSQEAEYKDLADIVVELTWLQALLNKLGICSSSTLILWCVNLGATYLSANPIFHARTKHVEIDYHFVRISLQSHYQLLDSFF